MQLKFLGAAGTVTGSGYVLTSKSGQSIIVDLGMFQGLPEIEVLNFKPIDCDFSKITGIVLTHAHLDHVGRLPLAFIGGFKGIVWSTPATRDLAQLVLLDSAKIGRDDDHALYDREHVEQSFSWFKTANYNTQFKISDFSVQFYDAGHILGSSSVEVTDTGTGETIIFSGDLGNPAMDLLPPAAHIPAADYVVMESTYGDRLHPPGVAIDALAQEIKAIESNGGTLLIPAFALEKTQELLHWIKILKLERKIERETPVFLDSPMAIRATNLYHTYPHLFTPQLQQEMKQSDPFDFPGREITMSPKRAKVIDKYSGPKVIIAGSGMMMGGRILKHAATYLPIGSTRLFLVGYQGEGTLGREIDEGTKKIEINDKIVTIRCHVNRTQTMSSHADQSQLLDWLKNIKGVKSVVLTHGEDDSRKTLAQKIQTDFGIGQIHRPLLNEEITLTN